MASQEGEDGTSVPAPVTRLRVEAGGVVAKLEFNDVSEVPEDPPAGEMERDKAEMLDEDTPVLHPDTREINAEGSAVLLVKAGAVLGEGEGGRQEERGENEGGEGDDEEEEKKGEGHSFKVESEACDEEPQREVDEEEELDRPSLGNEYIQSLHEKVEDAADSPAAAAPPQVRKPWHFLPALVRSVHQFFSSFSLCSQSFRCRPGAFTKLSG